MPLGVKLLIGVVSLATASCGGYVIYEKVSSSTEEKGNVSKDETPNNQEGQRSGELSAPETVSHAPQPTNLKKIQ